MNLDRLHDARLSQALLITPERQRKLSRACQHILAAYSGEEPVHIRDDPTARWFNIAVSRLQFIRWFAYTALIVLTYYERPTWCVRAGLVDGQYACDTKMYPGWGHTFLPLSTAFFYETIAISTLVMFELLRIYTGSLSYMRLTTTKVNWAFLTLAIADLIFAYVTPATFFRLAPLFRIGLFMNASSDVRREFLLLIQLLPALSSVVVLVVLWVAFFAFFGLVLFNGVPGSEHYFGTFGRSMWQLWVLATTSNWPDIMVAVYNKDRASWLFFFIFLVIVTFFLMNLFTGVVMDKYEKVEQQYEYRAYRDAEYNLWIAFNLLDEDGSGKLNRVELFAVISELRRAALLPDLPEVQDDEQNNAAAALLFAALDTERSELITWREFKELVTVLKVEWEREDNMTMVERNIPTFYHSPFWQSTIKVVKSSAFEWICDITVLLMCAVTIWQQVARLDKGDLPEKQETDSTIDGFWNIVELGFTSLFAVEVMIKVLVYGWRDYWKNVTYRLEFVTAVACVVVALAVYTPVPANFTDARWIRFAAFLRLINLLRLFSVLQLPSMLRFVYIIFSVRPIEVFYEVFILMLPSAARLFKMMFCMIFIFGAIGVTCFGGLVSINPDDPNYQTLKDMDYGTSEYWGMNFNDMAAAMVLMVQILVVNNWMVFVEAYGAVGHAGAWVFFIVFHFLGVIAGLNIFLSFVIDTYKEGINAEDDDDEMGENFIEGLDDQPVPSPTARRPWVIVQGEKLTSSPFVRGRWRASMKGFATNKAKAEQLISILRQKAAEEGRTTLPDRLMGSGPMPDLINFSGGIPGSED